MGLSNAIDVNANSVELEETGNDRNEFSELTNNLWWTIFAQQRVLRNLLVLDIASRSKVKMKRRTWK